MDPLKRNNPGVRATDHENRIQVLERRIFPQATMWALARLTTPQTISAGATEDLNFDSFWTSQPTIFRTTTNTAGDNTVLCNEFGVYIATSSVEWEDVAASYAHSSSLNVSRLTTGKLSTYGAAAATASEAIWPTVGGAPLDTGDVMIGVHSPFDYTESQPVGVGILAANGHSADVDVLRAFVMIALLPSDEPDTTYIVY